MAYQAIYEFDIFIDVVPPFLVIPSPLSAPNTR
jgi:hypothetical protein